MNAKKKISKKVNFDKVNEDKLWKDMMKNVQIFTKTSLTLIKSMQRKMGILQPGDERLNLVELMKKLKTRMEDIQTMAISADYDNACKCIPEEITHESNSEKTFEFEGDEIPSMIDLHKPSRVIKKKKFKYSSDIESKINARKQKKSHACECVKNNEDIIIVDACLCDSMPQKLRNEKDNDVLRSLKICSGLNDCEFCNTECPKSSGKEGEEDALAIRKPGYDPDQLPQDDNHPLIIKAFGKPFELECDDSLGGQLFTSMRNFGDLVAQIDAKTGQKETYNVFLDKTISTALELQKTCTKNDIVGICSSNHENTFIPYLAALFNGNKVVGFDRAMPKENFITCLKNVTPKIMFVSVNSLNLVEDCMRGAQKKFSIIVFGDAENGISFDTFLSADSDQIKNYEPNEADCGCSMNTAVICFTGSDTPRAVCLTHFGLLKQCMQLVKQHHLLPIILDFSEINRISCLLNLFVSIFSGSTRVIIEKFEAHNVWSLIEKFQIRTIYMLPQHCVQLSKCAEPTEDISSLFCIITGGERLKENIVIKLEELTTGRIISRIYENTELSGLIAIHQLWASPDLVNAYFNFGSCGRAIDGVLYKVLDMDTGKILDHSKVGELFVKSNMVRRGYYVNNMEKLKNDDDKWISTGDLVSYDTYGNFYHAGKKMNLIKYRNKTIIPSKLEEILLENTSVEAVIVIGVPRAENAQRIIACVALSDKEDIYSKDLEVFWNKQEKKYVETLGIELNLEIKIINEMPYHNGRINRTLLVNRFLSKEI